MYTVKALIRDRYQCMITGIYDRGAPESILSQTMRETQPTVHLECAHIVPDSTYFDVEKTKEKRYSASVLAVLKRFGYDVEPIHSNKVHSLLNIMTVSYDVHDAFDRLELWLEATNQVNRYRVFTAPKFLIPGGLPEFIEFTSSYPKLPLPSPDLLALHAVCAKVAHLSGAGEYIEQLDRNVEELCVLAADGQSFYTLEHALMRATPSIIDVGG
ncbi:hypothetical protein DFH05DRAFT_1534083 [Lentinula detonsa]|uniref:HNH nuclease domain-containing protein n=1 Tax=Lentinula detonsa TaxID=2804962 RepID=A0A9W8P728_9AGAR|nr:hypothetical protein DFH05DRAFT_1534083 [Lentinula detonsa]KAJ3981177.1 hypothetical protein F5890DRAFT_1618899 [Lentinula detonsa]